jgi:Holliday junction resolvase RusA-like endonuclease
MGGNAPITVIYDGTPQPKARARFGRGHAYTPAGTVDYQHNLGWAAKAAMADRKPLTGGAVKLTALFELPVPTSWAAARRNDAIAGLILPTGKPDLDNYVKAALDAINGIVVEDDAQVVEISACKVYGVNPKTTVTVAPLNSGARP